MAKIKCLLLDDEPLALNVLESYILQFPHLELAGKCTNPLDAISILKSRHIDLLFLDIKMPVLNGINLLKTLSNPPKVILATAYRDYALESYDLNVLDYLLKPISFERFVIAINKFQPVQVSASSVSSGLALSEERFVYFKSNKKMIKVFLKDILWVESLRDYIKIITKEQTIVSYERISHLEEKLPDDMFMRIHRSFIVAIDHIRSFTSLHIQVADSELPIGRLYKNEVLKQLKAE
ncbi:LytR/AlgR family response regulator transcription factor [Mucilaginibacter ginsenosidivorans]|uniref:Response regulator transcription factor n=1 Tax=Mucilaginibacter ginsenosidivorans TaxID=398053 RepID=A0A5B8V205_9SPHI|nr:LytTR family DNA-binding domain-containing protein [Mucilaginibacter ginsenosidivorans]QEC65208.1 response regulator transcription factor [Mucilaginibacter ginsenosidivorans]